jgi:hypothetical protein
VFFRFGDKIPGNVGSAIVTELKTYINVQDLHNLGLTMHIVAQMQSTLGSLQNPVQAEIMPVVKEVIQSPLLHSAALEGIQEFFAAYSRQTKGSADKLVPELFQLLVRPGATIPTAEDGGTQAFANVAKCIGTVVENSHVQATSVVDDFIKSVKVRRKLYSSVGSVEGRLISASGWIEGRDRHRCPTLPFAARAW